MTTINGKACVANGRNLYADTDFNNLDLWYANQYWTKQPDKYANLAVMQTTGNWNGLSQYVKVKTGEVYTFSLYARYTNGTGNSNIYWLLNADPESGHASARTSVTHKMVNLSDNWQRISVTTTITVDGYIRPRLERSDNNDNVLQIAGIKLETGTLATPLSPAPVDKVFSDGKQVYGRNLVTGTSNELKTITASAWGGSSGYPASGTYGAGKYYASAYIENTTPVDMLLYIRLNGNKWNQGGSIIQPGKSGISSVTLDVLDGQSLDSTWVGFANSQTKSYTYKYKEVMITRAPTPWSPAPEDVM